MSRKRSPVLRSRLVGPGLLGLFGITTALASSLLDRPVTEQAGGSASSRLIVLNPGAASSEAAVRLQGLNGACSGKEATVEVAEGALPPGGMAVLDLRDAGVAGLPGDCDVAGTVTAKGAAVAALVLTDGLGAGSGLAGYLAQAPSQAATDLWLPLWGVNGAGAERLVVSNPNADVAALQVSLFDQTGKPLPCDACRFDLAGGRSQMLPIADLGREAGAALGTARLTARQALVAVALGQLEGPDAWAAGLTDAGAADPWLPGLFAGQVWTQSSPAALLARSLGSGRSSIQVVSGSKDTGALLLLRDMAGKLQARLTQGPVGPGASMALDLGQVESGLYNGQVTSAGQLGAWSFDRWPDVAALAASAPAAPATDLLLPYLWGPDKDHAAWILVGNGQETSPARVQVAIYGAGSRKALATWSGVLPPGGFEPLDLGNQATFPGLDAGGPYWATVSADLALGVKVLLASRGAAAPGVAAYEGLAAAQLARELHAPWLRLGPGAPDQSTPSPSPRTTATPIPETKTPDPGPSATATQVPTATPTASASPTATVLPTESLRPPLPATPLPPAAPSPDPRSGWQRLMDVTSLGQAMGLQRLARGPDGTLWCLLEGPKGGRLVALDPQGGLRRYRDRREAAAAEFGRLVRQGGLPGFWSVDAAGRLWVGAAHYDGQGWVQVLPEQADGTGALRAGDQSLALPSGRAWVAQEAQVDCAQPRGCGRLGLRSVDAAGLQGEGIDLSGEEAKGLGDGPGLLYLGPVAGAAARGTSRQQAIGGVAVTRWQLYLLDEGQSVNYPLLDPPARGRLRHGGEATASFIAPGGLTVITWIEEQLAAGPRPRIYLQRWDPAGRRWRDVEDLSAASSPLAGAATAGRRITAAAEAEDGTLWLGTDQGQLFARRGRAWSAAQIPPGAGDPRILGLMAGSDGSVIVATADALYRYAGGSFRELGLIHLPRLSQTRP